MAAWAAIALLASAAVQGEEPPIRITGYPPSLGCAPESFDAAVACLRARVPANVRAQLIRANGANSPNQDFGGMLMWNWFDGQEAPLWLALRADGFEHPDDMIEAIVAAYVAAETGRRYDKAAALARYAAYWQRLYPREPEPITFLSPCGPAEYDPQRQVYLTCGHAPAPRNPR